MPLPVGLADLVANQPVGGLRVGYAQQGLGKAHDRHAFLAGEVVFAHEGVDPARVAALRADANDELAREVRDFLPVSLGKLGFAKKLPDRAGLVPGNGYPHAQTFFVVIPEDKPHRRLCSRQPLEACGRKPLPAADAPGERKAAPAPTSSSPR